MSHDNQRFTPWLTAGDEAQEGQDEVDEEAGSVEREHFDNDAGDQQPESNNEQSKRHQRGPPVLLHVGPQLPPPPQPRALAST